MPKDSQTEQKSYQISSGSVEDMISPHTYWGVRIKSKTKQKLTSVGKDVGKLEPKWCGHWAELKVVFLLHLQYHFGTQPGEWKDTSQVHAHRKHYSNVQNIEATCMSTNR